MPRRLLLVETTRKVSKERSTRNTYYLFLYSQMIDLDYPDIAKPVEADVQRAVRVLVVEERHQRRVVRLHRLLEVLAGEVAVSWRFEVHIK